MASEYGHTEVVSALLNAGANIHAMNDRALRKASLYGRTEVVRLLFEAGAKDDDGREVPAKTRRFNN